MNHYKILIPMELEQRDFNFACVTCVCIQDRQKRLAQTLVSPLTDRSEVTHCVLWPYVTQPPPPTLNKPQLEFKNKNSSYSDAVSHFREKKRRITSEEDRKGSKEKRRRHNQAASMPWMCHQRSCLLHTPSALSTCVSGACLKGTTAPSTWAETGA